MHQNILKRSISRLFVLWSRKLRKHQSFSRSSYLRTCRLNLVSEQNNNRDKKVTAAV